MKKSIQTLLTKLDGTPILHVGFKSIRGGHASLSVLANGTCDNSQVCQGTNNGKCNNTGDCSHTTNQGIGCTNSGAVCYY